LTFDVTHQISPHPRILRKKNVHYIEKYFPGVCGFVIIVIMIMIMIIIIMFHLWGSRMQIKKKTSGGKPAIRMQAHCSYP